MSDAAGGRIDRPAARLPLLREPAKVVVLAADLIHDAAAADGGMVMAGDGRHQAAVDVGNADAFHDGVDSGPQRRHAILRLASQRVVIIGTCTVPFWSSRSVTWPARLYFISTRRVVVSVGYCSGINSTCPV